MTKNEKREKDYLKEQLKAVLKDFRGLRKFLKKEYPSALKEYGNTKLVRSLEGDLSDPFSREEKQAMIDRSELNRALAKAIAYKECNKPEQAEKWARVLVQLLECANILTDERSWTEQWREHWEKENPVGKKGQENEKD